VRHLNRLGMAGVDLVQALADARTQTHRSYPALREALPAFLDEQVKLGNLRESTRRARARLMSRRSLLLAGVAALQFLNDETVGDVVVRPRLTSA
jgi:hypothetical protein